MKIICICGSPRSGCTEYILKQVSDALDAELILLRDQNIGLCQGCMSCFESHDCFITDDSQTLIEKMRDSDLVIFGVPNYFDNVSGLFKNFADRLLPMYKNKETHQNDALKRKKVVFIYVGGGGEDGTVQDVYDALNSATKGMVKYLDLDVVGQHSFVCSEMHEITPQQSKIDEMITAIKGMVAKWR